MTDQNARLCPLMAGKECLGARCAFAVQDHPTAYHTADPNTVRVYRIWRCVGSAANPKIMRAVEEMPAGEWAEQERRSLLPTVAAPVASLTHVRGL